MFIRRYQHNKLYVDIAVEAATDLRRRRSCRRPCCDYFDNVNLYLQRICIASTCTITGR
jgi:hypothetical protein